MVTRNFKPTSLHEIAMAIRKGFDEDAAHSARLKSHFGDPEHFYLPCPSCGSNEHVEIHGDGGARFVECEKCDVVGPWIEGFTNAEQICVEVWNIRGAMPQSVVDALCAMNNHKMPEKETIVFGHAPCPGCGFVGLTVDAEEDVDLDDDESPHIWISCARCSGWSVTASMKKKESVEDVLKRWNSRP